MKDAGKLRKPLCGEPQGTSETKGQRGALESRIPQVHCSPRGQMSSLEVNVAS